MSDDLLEYIQGAELGDATVTWYDSDEAVHQFASGWTFALRIGTPGTAAVLTKTSGITGANAAPNVTIAWATTGELNTLTPGVYSCHLIATRSADSKQLIRDFRLRLGRAITA